MSEQKLDIIDPKAVVSIKVSTGFYQKMQETLAFITKNYTQEQLQSYYTEIKTEAIVTAEAEVLQTMFIFLKEFQEEARKKDFVKKLTKSEAQDYLKEVFPDGAPELKVTDESLGIQDDSEPEQP